MTRGIKIIVLLLCAQTSTVNVLFSADSIQFSLSEIPVYEYTYSSGSEILAMDYASAIITNFQTWNNKAHEKKVYQVDIIFTKYPLHKQDWITNYDTLLWQRVKSVCTLEPDIDPSKIKWNLILQTDCKTEGEAKNLFHGVILWYKEAPEIKGMVSKAEEVIASSDIEELVSGKYIFPDSSVFHVLERNTHWKNMLIVSDWTASMYQYGAQAVLWYKNGIKKNTVSTFVFFNDGDNKKNKRIGKTGGIYFANPENMNRVIEIMEKVQKNGNGGDAPENDIEALIKAVEKASSFREVLLIADNKSPVKDMSLLKNLKVPVRVIVCGCRKGETILHDYLQIASATKGSVHTTEDDIWNISDIKEGERITILDIDYQRTNGRIVKTKSKTLKAHL